jgi:hypothetical protein
MSVLKERELNPFIVAHIFIWNQKVVGQNWRFTLTLSATYIASQSSLKYQKFNLASMVLFQTNHNTSPRGEMTPSNLRGKATLAPPKAVFVGSKAFQTCIIHATDITTTS